MAPKFLTSSGNWSNPSVWSGSSLPGPSDIVYMNGQTVTIDTNVNVKRIDFRRNYGEIKQVMVYGALSSSTARLRINGGSELTRSGSINTNTNLYLGSGLLIADVAEIIFTSTIVSDTNRQLIEGYLAHKWNLASDLPVTHPYKNSPPSWTPAQISTSLWLDASDASTVTQNSGVVSQWRDKSGNSRHANSFTPGIEPYYNAPSWTSNSVISFINQDLHIGSSMSLPGLTSQYFSSSSFSTFTVFKSYNTTQNQPRIDNGYPSIWTNLLRYGTAVGVRTGSATGFNLVGFSTGDDSTDSFAYSAPLTTGITSGGGTINVTDSASAGKSLTCTATGAGMINANISTLDIGRINVSISYPNYFNINSSVNHGQEDYTFITWTGSGVLNVTGGLYVFDKRYPGEIILHNGIGQINIIGGVYHTGERRSIGVIGSGILTVNGVVSNAISSGGGSGPAIVTTSGTVSVTGTVTSSSGGSNTISISGASRLVVNGTLYKQVNSTSNATQVFNNGGTFTLNGTFTGSTNYSSVYVLSTSGMNYFSGPFDNSPSGQMNIFCARWAWIYSPLLTPAYWRMRNYAQTVDRNLFTADNILGGLPAQSNVRSGVIYGTSNDLTGICVVPAASSVSAGVPVDDTVGTAVLSPSDVWNYALSSITNPSTIGARVKNAVSVDQSSAIVKGAFT